MYIYMITLEVSGDQLYPEKLIDKLSNELSIQHMQAPGEVQIFKGKERKFDFGYMRFKDPNFVCLMSEDLLAYEEKNILFLKENYTEMIKAGVEDIDITYEVFFTGDICNMEIFNKTLLKEITHCNASLLLSTYCMSKDKIMDSFNLTEEQFEE